MTDHIWRNLVDQLLVGDELYYRYPKNKSYKIINIERNAIQELLSCTVSNMAEPPLVKTLSRYALINRGWRRRGGWPTDITAKQQLHEAVRHRDILIAKYKSQMEFIRSLFRRLSKSKEFQALETAINTPPEDFKVH